MTPEEFLVDFLEARDVKNVTRFVFKNPRSLYWTYKKRGSSSDKRITFVDYVALVDLIHVLWIIPDILRADNPERQRYRNRLNDVFGISDIPGAHHYITVALSYRDTSFLQLLVDIYGDAILLERPLLVHEFMDCTVKFLLSKGRSEKQFAEKLVFVLCRVPQLLLDGTNLKILRNWRPGYAYLFPGAESNEELLIEEDYDLLCQVIEQRPEIWHLWGHKLPKLLPLLAQREKDRLTIPCSGLLNVVIRIIMRDL